MRRNSLEYRIVLDSYTALRCETSSRASELQWRLLIS